MLSSNRQAGPRTRNAGICYSRSKDIDEIITGEAILVLYGNFQTERVLRPTRTSRAETRGINFYNCTFHAPLKSSEKGLSTLFLRAFIPVLKVTSSLNSPVVRVWMHVASFAGLYARKQTAK